jgi:tetratricopeptide (TPR) repeat protein
MIPLGPFVLESVLGRGGMAVVWRAHHREQGTPVAVKVLTSDAARNPLFFKTFRSEARGAAGLDHPGIVAVYDHGLVSDGASERSGGELLARSPYLVMEIAGPGTLSPLKGKLPWPELQAVLLALLDGLAHAHARGVVHRDIKPANVLVGGDGRVKLTDFGLVHAFTHEGAGATGAEFMGTPAYMAPEQLEVRWRDFGPWTDLYALGCLGWALTTGSPPHGMHLSMEQALTAHLRLQLPPLLPLARVPVGFEGWLRRLLGREPRQRFQRAADAAWALASLGPASTGVRVSTAGKPVAVRRADPVTVVVPGVDGVGRDEIEPPTVQEERAPAPAPSGGPPASGVRPAARATTPGTHLGGGMGEHPRIPPLPATWKRPDDGGAGAWMRGVGLGVYGSRRIPLVDREAERDILWGALRATRSLGASRAVVLQGSAGSGKTRLATWIAERAHETGAATVLTATHGPAGGPGHGLGPMLSRFGRFDGLDQAQIRRRAARMLADRGRFADAEIDAVVELLRPVGERGRTHAVQFRNPEERHLAIRTLLAVLSRERPLLLVFDEAHHGVDTLAFTRSVLEAQDQAPVLMLLTVRDDLLVERPAEAELLHDLTRRPEVESISIGALPEEHRGALVRGLLGLEGSLADAVERRTAGNPLFAVELVGDWVQRGLLEAGTAGFRLRKGAEAHLPDDLHAVWRQRIERATAGRAPDDAHALELAAVLGASIEPREWEQVCGLAELRPAPDLVDHLAEQRLVQLVSGDAGESWRFVHGMLAESLVRRAEERGRLEEHHEACAAMLAGRRDVDSVERRGRHLSAAGRHRAALRPLAEAIASLLGTGALRRAEGLLALYEQAVARSERLAGHPAAVQGAVLRARVERLRGDLHTAAGRAREAVLAVASDTSAEGRSVYRDALIELGNCSVHMGELAEARTHLQEALRLALRQGDSQSIALCRRQMAYVRMSEGELVGATREARESIFAAEECAESAEVAQGYQILSRCMLLRGELEQAAFLLQEARLRFERAGARWGVATAINSMGEIAREQGEVRAAEDAYRDAAARYEAIGAGDAVYPRINLGLLLVEEARWQEALDILLPLRLEVSRQRRGTMEAAVAIALLAPLAAQGRWEEFDLFALRSRALLLETGFVEPDLARKARMAGDLARDNDQPERARAAWTIARDQWKALGRTDDLDDAEEVLAALPPAS